MNESPFSKASVKIGREDGQFKKFQESTRQFIHDSFVDAIPSDDIKQLPPRYMYPLAWIMYLTLLFTFFAIFLYGYENAISQQYLSPTTQNSYTPDKYCETISTVNTGSYMCTQSGVWQGSSQFVYADGSYYIQVSSFAISYADYSKFMNGIYDQLVAIGNIAMNSDLTVNLIYWMSLKFVLSGIAGQSFLVIGTPLTVFNRQKTAGTVSTAQSQCNESSEASFDPSTGLMTLSYNYDAFVTNPACYGSMTPKWFDYVPQVNGETFSIEFDIRTLITVVAVELGVLSLSSITEISSFNNNITYNNEVFQVKKYIDDAYPNMAPMNCIFDSQDGFACVMKVSSYIIAYPVFNHAGSNSTFPTACACASLTAAEIADRSSPCNLFDLLSGFIFFDSQSPFPMIDLMERYDFDMTPVNRLAFNASFVASYYGQTSPLYDELNDPEYRTSIYEFCNNCSLVTFTSFDVIQSDWSISEYYYQLETGACTNTFTTTYADWELLITTPYTSLNEQYEQCHNDPTTVLFNQIGVSVGNVAIVAPICIVFVLFLLSIYSILFNVTIPKSYAKSDKDRALNAFAIGLLLSRDHRWTNNDSKESLNSIMLKLTEELTQHAEQSNNHYSSKLEDEQGINWSYLFQRTFGKKSQSISSPIHSRKNSAVPEQEMAVGVSRSKQDLDALRASTVPDIAALSVLLAAPGVTVLNKPPTSKLEEMVYEWTPVTDIVVKVIECIAGFASIATQETGGYQNSVAYWTQASKTVCFCGVRLIQCTPEERQYLYSKFEDLMLLHTSILMNCKEEKVLEGYGGSVAYFFNREVLTLNEIHTRAMVVVKEESK